MTRSAYPAVAAVLIVACGSPSTGGGITVTDARVLDPLGSQRSAFYATIANSGPEADTLLGLSTVSASAATLHITTHSDGITRMSSTHAVVIPGRGETRLEPGGFHGMLEGLPRAFGVGDTVQVTLRLARAGSLVVRALVTDPIHARH